MEFEFAFRNEVGVDLMPSPENGQFAGLQFAICASQYNQSITDKLVEGALHTFSTVGIPRDAVEIVRVPGAWELALGTRWLIDTQRFAAIVTLGAVIKGETTHDEHINRFVSLSVGQLSLDSGIPIAFGLLTCNNLQQAVERSGGRIGNKGEEAAEAALDMLRLKHTIGTAKVPKAIS